MRFCLDKGVRVIPIPLYPSGDKISLEIHKKGAKTQKSKLTYNKDNMTAKIIELYHLLAVRNGYLKVSKKMTDS